MIRSTLQQCRREVTRPEENKISVIVSIYNIAPYLERSLASLCGQTYRNLEIILSDDGSTDESGSICDTWAGKDERIRVIHKENGGLSSARNAGIAIATGKYIAFVDGDDWIEETMYEDMLLAIQTWDAQLAVCNYREVSREGIRDTSTEDVTLFEGREALEAFIAEDPKYQIQNAAWNKLYLRSLPEELRFPEGKLFEDIVYTTRLLAGCSRCVYLNKAYYNYVVDRSDSIMNSRKLTRILTDQIPAYEEKKAFLLSLGERELADTHQFFFYKRMLYHYREAFEQRPEGYKEFIRKLRQVIGSSKDVDWSIYEGHGDRRGDRLRLRLFVTSPLLYRMFNRCNEAFLIPARQRKALRAKEMNLICLTGGLGNQLFQYALYLTYRKRGQAVKIDDVTEYRHEKKRTPQLAQLGLFYEKASPEEICEWRDEYLDLFSRIRRKLKGRRSRLVRDMGGAFQPEVLTQRNAYLYGWWQSQRYFKEAEAEVRSTIFTALQKGLEQASQEDSARNHRYLKEICSCESVGLHIRRGDYLEVEELYGGICPPCINRCKAGFLQKGPQHFCAAVLFKMFAPLSRALCIS